MKYRFAKCCLDTDRHIFERDGRVIHLEPQVFDLLCLLVRSAGDLVTHDTLVSEVWQGLAVSNATISSRVNTARRAVGDDGKTQQIIETVARRGLRLAAPVEADVTAPGGRTERAPGTFSEALPTLLILPFHYLGDDPGDTLSEGFVDEITSALGRVKEFDLIARQSTFAPGREQLDSTTTSSALVADYFVEGTIHRYGERWRIGISLLNSEGRTLWRHRFDDNSQDFFDLQERIAASVAGQLPVKVREAEAVRASQSSDQPDSARIWVMRALPKLWSLQPQSNLQAIELLSRATEIDSTNVRALAYKAWAVAHQPTYMWSNDADADRREACLLASQAAVHVGNDPPALVAIGAAYSLTKTCMEPAQALVRRALELDPSNAWGHLRQGWALVYDGQPTAALPAFDRARSLSPLDPFLSDMNLGMAAAYADMGETSLAVRIVNDTLAYAPHFTWAYCLLASCYGRMGEKDKAADAAGNLREAYPDLTAHSLLKSLPPAVSQNNPGYLEGLKAAGLL